MCFLAGRHTTIAIKTAQSRLVAAVKHNSIDTVSELLSETLVEACKEAGLKAKGSKIKCKSQTREGNLFHKGYVFPRWWNTYR